MKLSEMILRDTQLITDFTADDLDAYKGYFRFQCLDWAPREVSHGMIYANAEEALEDDSTVLDGKSCVSNWRQLRQFADSFDSDFAVLVFTGQHNGTGHDGEDVVIPDEFIAALDYNRFMEIIDEEIERYKREGWSLLDFTC